MLLHSIKVYCLKCSVNCYFGINLWNQKLMHTFWVEDMNNLHVLVQFEVLLQQRMIWVDNWFNGESETSYTLTPRR